MSLILLVWFLLCLIFLGVPIVYYLYMRRIASLPWKLRIDKDYRPQVTVLVPMHNEEKSIALKLENLWKTKYPQGKMQVILVNDSSTDETLKMVQNFLTAHDGLNVEILNLTEHVGKSRALNTALAHVKGDIAVVSDADCFWSPDILIKALPYLSDPSVGAVTGLEKLLNPKQSWVTQTEVTYNDAVHMVRIGESKIHSTIFFQGGFGAYKRSVLQEFDPRSDDSGTALNLVQKKARTLLIPEAVYFTTFPSSLKGKVAMKRRRASQLLRLWSSCFKLLVKRQLVLPKRISVPEMFLYIFNPIVFLALIGATLFLSLTQPVFLLSLSVILVCVLLVNRSRTPFIEVVQDTLIVLSSLFSFSLKNRFVAWKTAESSRSYLTRDMLEREKLV